MAIYKVRWLCPECGKLHQMTMHGANVLDVMHEFVEYWRDVNEILLQDFQLPILMIEEINSNAA
jgi:hypothetical protein